MEESKIVIKTEVELREAIKKLSELNKTYIDLKNSQEASTKEINAAKQAVHEQAGIIKDYWKSYEVGKKSMNELSKTARQLNSIIRELEPGTEDWNELSVKLKEVRDESTKLTKQMQAA